MAEARVAGMDAGKLALELGAAPPKVLLWLLAGLSHPGSGGEGSRRGLTQPGGAYLAQEPSPTKQLSRMMSAAEEVDLTAALEERAELLSAVPEDLRQPLLMLAAMPANTPIPTAVLARLWSRLVEAEDVVRTVDGLEQSGLVLSAQPTEYSVWVLVTPEVQEHLQVAAQPRNP